MFEGVSRRFKCDVLARSLACQTILSSVERAAFKIRQMDQRRFDKWANYTWANGAQTSQTHKSSVLKQIEQTHHDSEVKCIEANGQIQSLIKDMQHLTNTSMKLLCSYHRLPTLNLAKRGMDILINRSNELLEMINISMGKSYFNKYGETLVCGNWSIDIT